MVNPLVITTLPTQGVTKPWTLNPAINDIVQTINDIIAEMGSQGVGTVTQVNGQFPITGAVTLTPANIAESATRKWLSDTERGKLAGIAGSATANSSDVFLLGRSNHSGTQAIATIEGLQTTLNSTVRLSGTQTINGATTFSSPVVIPAPSTAMHAATKKYVDDTLTASPALTGTPTAPTASLGTNTTQIATMAAVKAAVDAKTVTVGLAELPSGTTVMVRGATRTSSRTDLPFIFINATDVPFVTPPSLAGLYEGVDVQIKIA